MTFTAQLTPQEMLIRGVFGKSYFQLATPEDLLHMEDSVTKLALQNRNSFDENRNYYHVKAGADYAMWSKNGWIFPEDPLGWFHWYCRYSNGRRHERDDHQIARYNNYGLRWGKRIAKQIVEKEKVSRVILQGLLQWGYDPETHGQTLTKFFV